ncbi:sensor domain-containing diguanylate cyclase, partial [Acetobacterium paludosum]|uniref:sensor domain-containing diguanylate cyclase n=1 Tax=Acetobacterium paludosum TaxID=52693 RepID=UPI0011E038F3
WCKERLLNNQIVYLPNPGALPLEADEERAEILKHQIQSIIGVPICSKDTIIGFIGFDHVTGDKAWKLNDHEMLRVLANILADAIAKVETENKMNILAYYDALTSLPNRVLFCSRLEQALDLAKRSENLLGVIFLDIDGFKEVNDTMGHDWGDYLLNEVAKRLTNCIRNANTVSRFGGDEFLIMMPQMTRREDLEELAWQITGLFHKPITVGEQEFYITASSGLAV